MARRESFLSFPNPVNEVAARTVAAGVVVMSLAVALGAQGWVLIPLTYGFVARVLSGPRLSPLGLLATRVVAPSLPDRAVLVPGPPKRFAQGIGVVFSLGASLLWLAGAVSAARVVAGALAAAALLEAAFGLCIGCLVFGRLMRVGVIPERVCVECNDLSLRRPDVTERVS